MFTSVAQGQKSFTRPIPLSESDVEEVTFVYNPYGWRGGHAVPGYVPAWLQHMSANSMGITGHAYPGGVSQPTGSYLPESETEARLEGELSDLATELSDDPQSPSIDDVAPDFELPGYVDARLDTFSLSTYRGRWTVLLFYGGDFTFVCPTELEAIAQRLNEFRSIGAEVIAISTDSVWSHRVFQENVVKNVRFPLLSDRSHVVSQSFGVLNRDTGASRRATFIVDPEGKIQHCSVYPVEIGRSVDEILRTLDALQFTRKSGQFTPVGWKRGERGIQAR